MSDIKQKALALVNEARAEALQRPLDRMTLATSNDIFLAFYYTVGQHEATKQELSDFKQNVDTLLRGMGYDEWDGGEIKQFIIPARKPDPLVEVLKALPVGRVSLENYSRNFRAALDAAGFEIREKNDGQ